ncbi:hypothetical protein FAM09_29070 [Niastella caeni]|uniref:Sulfatase N-terminal domain-containing protein n=2 Tax=Niastella caeni TaxID=2569763 RepID=A0A4V4GZ31_9BACT|nr:hypothetical protein FAM09_29070 [Niastella caeni]
MKIIQNIQERLGKSSLFLILLPVFYLLHMVTEYYPMLTLKDLFIPVTAWMLGLPVLLFLAIRYIKASWVQYAMTFFYLEIVYFFFSTIYLFIEKYIPFLAHYKYLLPLIVAIGVFLFISSRKKKAPPYRFFLYLNTLLIILVIVECIQLVIKTLPEKTFTALHQSNGDLPQLPPCDSCIKPDVHYIVFDGYAGSDALQHFWQYDNSALDSFFRTHGFYNVAHAKSNYNYTSFSIGSILNMDYHQRAFDQKIDLLLYCEGIKTIKNNPVCRLFQQLGYTIINQSFFPIPGDKPRQSISYLSNKKAILMSPTLPSRLINDIGWQAGIKQLTFNSSRFIEENTANSRLSLQQLQNTYKQLMQIAGQQHKKPAFVYSHFMLPHKPYLFDSTGHLTPDSTWHNNSYKKASYLSQLKHTNTVIRNIVTQLLKPGNRPRVIIIQSDHGYREFPKNLKQLEFSNLNAIYFPDQQYTGLYDSISSVNTFRVILRKYFNAPLPLLKDSTVYIRH